MKAKTPEKAQTRAEEELLWEFLKKGDDKAITYIVNVYSPGMHKHGLRFSNDVELIKDGVQDTFHDLLRKPPEKRPPESLQAYLNGALRNKLLKKIKRMSKMINESLLEMNEIEALRSMKNANSHQLRRERRALVKKAIKLLPSKQQRKAVFLRFFFGLTYKEIGTRLHINEEAAKKLVYRAYSLLKKNLDTGDLYHAHMMRKIDHLPG